MSSVGDGFRVPPADLPENIDAVVAAAVAAAAVETLNAVTDSGTEVTIPDVTAATLHRITLTDNCTFTFPSSAAGKSFSLALVQDATGSRTVTWPAEVKWPGGTAPTLTATASAVDYLTFVCSDGTTWAGFVAGLDVR